MCNTRAITSIQAKLQQTGFTLIELLVVVSVIGVLSGVMVGVIDSQRQKKVAEDAVKKANLEKLITGIEGFNAIEDVYPTDENADGNPVNDGGSSDDSLVLVYLKTWPQSTSGTYTYVKGSASDFAVYIAKSTNTEEYFKYYSGWTGIQECTSNNIQSVSACTPLGT